MINNNLLNRFIAEALIYKTSEKSLTQKEVSIALNVSESFLSDCIHGKNLMSNIYI